MLYEPCNMSNTTALAQQQCDLLKAIFAPNNIAFIETNTPTTGISGILIKDSIRGLQTYQANAAASAQRSLQSAYPTLAQLIGTESFDHLARDFWAQHPPTCGDLAQWGGDLAGFVTKITALQTEPYLSDVARAEWALHIAATAANQEADLATFASLTEEDPDTLTLRLAPGTALIHSKFPIASILAAHLYGSPSFEEVGQMLRIHAAETALVWRQGLRPMVTLCAESEAQFLAQLLAGKSLLSALENESRFTSCDPFNLQIWLPHALHTGLLLGVRSL
jgi:hypothetical protein